MIVWLNGKLQPAAEARIDPADRGLLLGDGVFETLRIHDGAPVRLGAHLDRLRAGADVLGFHPPWPDDRIVAALAATLAVNGLRAGTARLTLTRGPAERGLTPPAEAQPTLLIAAFPPAPPAESVRAVIARTTRRNEHSPLAGIKSLNRLDDVLARREAARRGADDALLLNSAGRLAEATVANLFIVSGGVPATPPLSDGALPGTVRAVLLRDHGAVERPIDPADLAGATEAFLTNALGLRALIAVDGRPVGDGRPGPVARRLAARLFG